MKVKATNPMVKVIRDVLTGCRVSLVKMTPEVYRVSVDYDVLRNTSDYNANTGYMQVIRIEYPAEYYALPQYVTTRDLARVYRNSNGSFQGFTEAIRNEYAI